MKLATLVGAMLAAALVASSALAQDADFEDPIGLTGHGSLFDPQGRPIEATPEFLAETLERYLDALMARANSETMREFEQFRERIANAMPAEAAPAARRLELMGMAAEVAWLERPAAAGRPDRHPHQHHTLPARDGRRRRHGYWRGAAGTPGNLRRDQGNSRRRRNRRSARRSLRGRPTSMNALRTASRFPRTGAARSGCRPAASATQRSSSRSHPRRAYSSSRARARPAAASPSRASRATARATSCSSGSSARASRPARSASGTTRRTIRASRSA